MPNIDPKLNNERLHQIVNDYALEWRDWTGEPMPQEELHYQIDNPQSRGELYLEFADWVERCE